MKGGGEMKGKKFLAAFGLVLLIGVGTGAFFMGKSVAQDVTTWKEAGFLYATLDRKSVV